MIRIGAPRGWDIAAIVLNGRPCFRVRAPGWGSHRYLTADQLVGLLGPELLEKLEIPSGVRNGEDPK